MDYRFSTHLRSYRSCSLPPSPSPPSRFNFVSVCHHCVCVHVRANPSFFLLVSSIFKVSPCICVYIENVIIFYDNFIYLPDKNKNLILYWYCYIHGILYYTFLNSKIPVFFFLQVRNISKLLLIFRRLLFFYNNLSYWFVL